MISEPDLRQILAHLGLAPKESELRAKFLMEDLEWIQFEEFHVQGETRYLPNDPETPALLAEYSFGPTKFNVNNADKSTDKRCTSISGTGLNSGNLLQFSKISKIARNLIPHFWLKSKKLKKALRSPDHHLATLNEIWWLGRFPTAVDVFYGHKQAPPKDIDWRFRLDGTDLWINLEVKYRPGDSARFVHNIAPKVNSLLQETLDKFKPSAPNELNLIGVTLFDSIDGSIQNAFAEWLLDQTGSPSRVDAILSRSFSALSGKDFDCQRHEDKTQILESGIVQPPDDEDQNFHGVLTHVLDRKDWPPELRASLPSEL
jgi:hypothetical protein